VHLNPNVRQIVFEILGNKPRIHLIDPLDYAPFASALKNAYIILTDSGGVQEEAPSLGKPVLVLRDETERPEAVESGSVKLIGSNKEKIVNAVQTLLNSEVEYKKMTLISNPYGDGSAAKRIVEIIQSCKDLHTS
jgi:UDP-N-acetylglucosamine 2-epimerase (non-hydrolysing)